MIQLASYQVGEKLYQGHHCRVYRAFDVKSQQSVAIKMASSEFPSAADLTELKHDYEIGQQLDDEHIVRYLGLEPYEHNLAIIMEDFGAISFEEYLPKQGLPLNLFLQASVQMAQALVAIHDQNIIHKDIKPRNILINPNTKQIKITDFGLASKLQHETQHVVSPEQLEGTLSYISPEQTGRMNRTVDYRSDFYSLGITYYKMLTGNLPFSTNDAMELVHCHIAKSPKPPQMIGVDVPEPLSELILILLAKNAEDRYQSARGIVVDLKKMQSMLQANSRIEDFKLRQQDVSGIFQIPQKLYGRKKEVGTLMTSFERAAKGPVEMMLVAGYSGIGKSSLVREVHRPIVGKRGYFILGKFDQFKRNEPYYAFIMAFKGLIKHLLTESENQLLQWKKKLLEALGINGQVIIDVIPEVELITGHQPPIEALDPTATNNRFNTTFGNFIRVLASKEHPLVMFIDDLQWADGPSLDLIQGMMMNQELRYTLLMGAYRSNEVDRSHPLIVALEKIRKAKGVVHSLTLSPLQPEHLNQLVSDTLGKSESEIVGLSKLIMNKTKGNPFFVIEFLNSLYREDLIRFDSDLMSWSWNVREIESKEITGNVVDLMIHKLKQLPHETRQGLTMGACLGSRFDLGSLALLTGKTVQDVAKNLWLAVENGIIVPVGKEHKLMVEMNPLDEDDVTLNPEDTFRHDRIQQAAYELIPEQDRPPVHLKIGRLLLEKYSVDELDEKLFYVTEQLNQGRFLVTASTETIRLVELNIKAAIRAKDSSAYSPAYSYTTIARELLPKNAWQDRYCLALSVYSESMELSFLTGQFEEMNQYFDIIIQNTTDVLDQLKTYETKIHYHTSQNQAKEAVEVALDILAKLGIKIPNKPTSTQVMLAVFKVKMAERNRSVEGFVNLPNLENPRLLVAIRIMMMMIPPAYVADPNITILAACESVRLSISNGICAESAFHFSIYSFFIAGGLKWIDNGYSYGKLALGVMEKFDDKKISTLVITSHYYFMLHWKEPYKNGIDALEKNVLLSYDVGNFEYVGWNAWMTVNLMFLTGQPIPELLESYDKYDHLLIKVRQELSLDILRSPFQMLLNLAGSNEDPVMLVGTKFDEQKMIDKMAMTPNLLGVFIAHFSIAMLGYFFGRFDRAIKSFEYLEKNLDTGLSLPILPNFYLYRALTYCALEPNATNTQKKIYRRRIKESARKLKKFAHYNPNNFTNKRDLLLAEWCRVNGRKQDAMSYYENAIKTARDEGFLHEEALANELYGRYWLSQKLERIGKTFLTNAHYLYGRWGAVAKCTILVEEFGSFIEMRKTKSVPIHGGAQRSDMTETITQDQQVPGSFDLATVLKASQTISSEIDLEKLLRRLITIIIENAGARSGHLLLEHEGHFLIEATVQPGSEKIEVLQSISFAKSNSIAEDIIRYVIRSGEDVILNDANKEGMFTTSTYITKNNSKSILCIPIRHQNKLQGLLYLENDEMVGAFTKERIELLRVLLSQAAISIVNARLYTNLEDKVEERTQALHNTMNQLIEAEKMAALGQLVAGVAHEINTPIGIGVTSASLLQEQTQQIADKHQADSMTQNDFEDYLSLSRDIADLVLNNMNRAANLVERFKTTAVNQSKEQKHRFKLKPYLEDILSSLIVQLRENHHRVTVNCDSELELEGYPIAFSLVINNLVMNSIIHGFKAREGGQITIDVNEDKETIQIEYHDNGIGISEDDIKKVFDPFFTTNMGTNTGLGMHIVYNIIVQQFGGTIRCETGRFDNSRGKSKGAHFYISLPQFKSSVSNPL